METTSYSMIKVQRRAAMRRWGVVLLLILAMAGGYMALYALSPLQSALQSARGWSPMAYGRYSSAESFLNVFCGFLLISGYCLDRFGVRISGILSTLLMLAGAAINYTALLPGFETTAFGSYLGGILNLPDAWYNITPFYDGMPVSAKWSAVGFMIFGVGVESAGVAASRATVRWFMGKGLAVAMGVQLAASRLAVAAALTLAPAVSSVGGAVDVARPMGLAIVVIAIGLISWILYAVMDKNSRGDIPDSTTKAAAGRLRLRALFGDSRLWLAALICLGYYSSVIPFYRYAANMFECTLAADAERAGTLLAALPTAAALVTPAVCYVADRYGGAVYMLVAGAAAMVCCQLAFALWLPATGSSAIALGGIILLGASMAVIAAGYWPMIPRLIASAMLGRAYAALYWLQNFGFWLMPLLLSWVLSTTNRGVTDPLQYDYTPTMLLFALTSLLTLLLTLRLGYLNRREGWRLNTPNIGADTY